MNILFLECFSGRKERQNFIETILNKVEVNNAFMVDIEIPKFDNNNLKSKLTFIDYHNVLDASYKNIDWNEIPPVDPILRKKFYELEFEFMSMIERLCGPDNGLYRKENYYETYKKLLINPFYKGNLEYFERLEMYLKHLRFWHYFLIKNSIDLVIYLDNAPHFGYDLVIYSLCKKLKIRIILDAFGPLTNYRLFIEDYKKLYNKQFQKYLTNTKEEELSNEDFINEWNRVNNKAEQQQPREFDKLVLKNEKRDNKRFWKEKFLRLKLNKNVLNLYYWHFQIRLSSYRYFNKILANYYNENCSQVDYLKDKYIYVPLHYQPEMTSSPMGGMYNYQLLMINQLSYYLPKGYYLYIKEHPRQSFKYRSIHFYGEILKHSNVKLISKDTSSFELIENSMAVASLTGTAGWEGLFKNKPFLMFGYHVYQFAPGVIAIRSNKDCKTTIMRVINNDITINIEQLKRFIVAYEKSSIKYDSDNNLKEFTKALIQTINTNKSEIT